MKVMKEVKLENSIKEINYDKKFQFLRKGYFILDKYSDKDRLIFNQSVALRSNWKK
jgi:glutaminyl-tRNA synthetase